MADSPTITVGIDADDTLWRNEEMFADCEKQFADMLAPWCSEAEAHAALIEVERQRVPLYGYGAKGFVLAMIETAVQKSSGEVASVDLARIVEWGRHILSAPVELLPGVIETLPRLAESYDLLLITKGDTEHQQRKIDESGLTHWFRETHVVAEKDPATYGQLLAASGTPPERFVMVGNSRRSDVDPVLSLGGAAVHLPYHITWSLEHAASDADHPRMRTAAAFNELPSVLAKLVVDLAADGFGVSQNEGDQS